MVKERDEVPCRGEGCLGSSFQGEAYIKSKKTQFLRRGLGGVPAGDGGRLCAVGHRWAGRGVGWA